MTEIITDADGTWEVTTIGNIITRRLITPSQELLDRQAAEQLAREAQQAEELRTRQIQDTVAKLSQEMATEKAQTKFISGSVTGDEPQEYVVLFSRYDVNSRLYTVGDIFEWNGWPYIVQQQHTSQPEFTPDLIPALVVPYRAPGVVSPWVQPESNNSYQIGERVTHNGSVWECNTANNVWEPGVFGWTEIVG